jgi:formylglycine-generating enzyme required for sulfatase activity
MGCNEEVDAFCDDDEHPYHEVYLDAFEIDMYEVTQSQYYTCVLANVCEMPQCLFDPEIHGDEPATCMVYDAARAFCEWSGKRLCTEAEWEKAARGTDGRRYPWGNEAATCEYAVMYEGGDGCGTGGMLPVGSKPLGASPYGTMDMAGNASEMVSDYYLQTYYSECPSNCTNPQGPSNSSLGIRVHRGGEFRHWAYRIRTSDRDEHAQSIGHAWVGFRCCR